MSAARMGRKWADVEEEEEEDGFLSGSPKSRTRFETQPDENGIKTVIEYNQKDGKTYKVTKKIKVATITTKTNAMIEARKDLPKFGKVALNDPVAEKRLIVISEEEVHIEVSKKLVNQVSIKDDAEDKFYEESLALADGLTKEKKAWTDMNRERQQEREVAGGHAEETKPAETAAAEAPAAAGSRYVPPSMRNAGKGGGKGADLQQQQEASLRVTNLSEDVREGDLQDLFGQFGRLQRVYLAKDMNTFQSRGFAFVTYYNREDAQRAIQKLNGHGYDNLILQVQFAKPRA